MKRTSQTRQTSERVWRVFSARDGRSIEATLVVGAYPQCPCCGQQMDARGDSRHSSRLPLDAIEYDLDCKSCRRFWSVIHHSERSLRLVRMRRFVAALQRLGAKRAKPVIDVGATA